MSRLRVVQWATGNIGTRSLRGVLEHPDLELVGVHVYDADKVGRDAGELAGLAPCRRARRPAPSTKSSPSQPDCVLYMPRACDFDEVARLLEAGSNVVTTRGEFHRPASMEPAAREQIEAACASGGTSIHSTGSSPGFITEALPIVLTSIQRRLDGVLIEEFADLSQRPSPELLFDIMGFGREPTEVGEGRLNHGRMSFGPSLHLLADALGAPLDDLEASGEMAVARHAHRDRRRHDRGGHDRRPADDGHRAARRVDRSCSSGPPGTAPPTSTPTGSSAPPAGGSRSTATRH